MTQEHERNPRRKKRRQPSLAHDEPPRRVTGTLAPAPAPPPPAPANEAPHLLPEPDSAALDLGPDPVPDLPQPWPLCFTAPWHYELRCPRDPRAPGIARLTLRAVLTAHGLAELVDRAELLMSELAANAVRHTRGPAVVRLQWFWPVLRVSVRDRSPQLPPLPGKVGRAEDSADGGRGMSIVDMVADRWGGYALGECPHGPGGKVLWFELALPDPPPDGTPASAVAA